MMMIGTPETREIAGTVAMIKPFLAGRPPAIQGAILADLLAIWLAGHHVAGNQTATKLMRAEVLAAHLASLDDLVRANARQIGTTP